MEKGGTGTGWNMSYTPAVVPTGTVNNNGDTEKITRKVAVIH